MVAYSSEFGCERLRIERFYRPCRDGPLFFESFPTTSCWAAFTASLRDKLKLKQDWRPSDRRYLRSPSAAGREPIARIGPIGPLQRLELAQTLRNTTHELIPPKPKALLSA
jgi:hypothetical protein